MNHALLLSSILARLGRYKAKTFVIGLGLAISVMATVIVQTASVSFRAAVQTFTDRQYPAGTVVLVSRSGATGQRDTLRLQDLEAVSAAMPPVTGIDPYVRGGLRELKQGERSTQVFVSGCSEQYEIVHARGVREGDFFTAEDLRNRAHVGLIGSTTAQKLFGTESPLGRQLYIDGVAFEIKGVLEKAGMDPHGFDQDDALLVPYTTLIDHVLHTDAVSAITYVLADPLQTEQAGERAAAVVRERHRIVAGQQDDFSLVTADQMQRQVRKTFRIFDIFVPLIGGTAFLIAGLVLLGIMMISVRERTAEIGLRRAVGARASDLQLQIVLEVLIIAAAASVAGLVLAKALALWLAPLLQARFGVRHFDVTPAAMGVGVLAALVTAMLGALLTARRAARMNPVTALR